MQIAWLIGSGVVFFTCTTIYLVPYFSFFYEITPDYNERTRVSSYSAFFGKVANLDRRLGVVFHPAPLFQGADGQANPLLGAQALSIILAVLTVGLGDSAGAVHEGAVLSGRLPAGENLAAGKPQVHLRNKPFLMLTAFRRVFRSRNIPRLGSGILCQALLGLPGRCGAGGEARRHRGHDQHRCWDSRRFP